MPKTDRGLSEPKLFIGLITYRERSAKVTLRVHVDRTGEARLDFDKLPLTDENMFVNEYWDTDKTTFTKFRLSATADDGTTFVTDDLQFNSVGTPWSRDAGTSLELRGFVGQIRFRVRLRDRVSRPILRMHVKGFQSFTQLTSACPAGAVSMIGERVIDDPDTLTGHAQVEGIAEELSLSWRTTADALLEHLRRVMSLASASVLRAPVFELFYDDTLEVTTRSQGRQASSPMRTIHYLHQQPFFGAAVGSFFNPPFPTDRLFFAIEWFAIDPGYNEIRLVNAMTALENLVDANLGDADVFFRSRTQFEKLKGKIREVLKAWAIEWTKSDEEQASIVREFNEKLNDLNRRSILQKVSTLADRWAVPLKGIDPEKFRAAKRARDLIIHRGHYYDVSEPQDSDLWQHVILVREIVTRFLLTAIGYSGDYISYVDGYHTARFPPA